MDQIHISSVDEIEMIQGSKLGSCQYFAMDLWEIDSSPIIEVSNSGTVPFIPEETIFVVIGSNPAQTFFATSLTQAEPGKKVNFTLDSLLFRFRK